MSREDIDETSRISEAYFETQNDPSQIPTTPEIRDWIYQHTRRYLNIIRADGVIVGYAFLLPCTHETMNDFLERKIDEATLFEKIKRVKLTRPTALYLCASVVEEKFRGRGLATTAFVKMIRNIPVRSGNEQVLFYFRYSEEGKKLADRVALATGLELRARV